MRGLLDDRERSQHADGGRGKQSRRVASRLLIPNLLSPRLLLPFPSGLSFLAHNCSPVQTCCGSQLLIDPSKRRPRDHTTNMSFNLQEAVLGIQDPDEALSIEHEIDVINTSEAEISGYLESESSLQQERRGLVC